MEGLAPPLKCLIEIQSALQNGEPARKGLARYLSAVPVSDVFASDVRRFLFAWDQGRDWKAIIAKIESPHRRVLLDLCATALSGQPILSHLDEFKSEMIGAVDLEIKTHLELLPIKMLVPLLLFQFPAFLLLLFGPLLSHLIQEINR
jgi:hypothetical protein